VNLQLGLELLLSSAFVINFKFAFGPGYFDTVTPASAILHFWSLSVEEQFYLLWPVFVVVIYKLPIRLRAGVVALVLIASFGLHLLLVKYHSRFAFYLFATRGWEFAVGSAIAMFSVYLPSRPACAGLSSTVFLVMQRRWMPCDNGGRRADFHRFVGTPSRILCS
jgi:peptidoglycan/LPS O-acetylase OafA/YrhL